MEHQGIIKDVTRSNVLEKIQELKDLGYNTSLIKDFQAFSSSEDYINVSLMYIDVDTTVIDTLRYDKLKKESKKVGEGGRHICKSKAWPGFEFKKALFYEIFSAIGGTIEEQKLIDAGFCSTVSYIGRNGKESFTGVIEKDVKFPSSSSLVRAIKKCFNYSGGYDKNKLKKGLILVRFDLNMNTKDKDIRTLFKQNLIQSLGLGGFNNNSNNFVEKEDDYDDVNDLNISDNEKESYEYDQIQEYDNEHSDVSTSEDTSQGGSEFKNPKFNLQNKKARAILSELGWSDEKRKEIIKTKFNVDSFKDFTEEGFNEFINYLNEEKKKTKDESSDDKEMQELYTKIKKNLYVKNMSKKLDEAIESNLGDIEKLNKEMQDGINDYIEKLREKNVK